MPTMNEHPYPLLDRKFVNGEFDEGIAEAAQFLTAMKKQKTVTFPPNILGSLLPIKTSKQDQPNLLPPGNGYRYQTYQTNPSNERWQAQPVQSSAIQLSEEQYDDAQSAVVQEGVERVRSHSAMISSAPSIIMNVAPPTVAMVQETMKAIQTFQYQHMFPNMPPPQILGPMNPNWQMLRPQPSNNFRGATNDAHALPLVSSMHINSMNHNDKGADQRNYCTKEASPTDDYDAFDVPRFINGREQQLRDLLTQQDKYLTTQFTFAVVDHLDFVYFEEGDRRSHRTHLPIGFRGIGCRYCQAPAGKSGRFFPSSLKTLSDTNKTLYTLHRHLIKCRTTPNAVKQRLDILRQSHDTERKLISAHGSQRAFFRRMWGFLCPKSMDKYERKRHNAVDK
eukprot:scaffold470_cov276-Chaetoceros_neogracile.AAC.7